MRFPPALKFALLLATGAAILSAQSIVVWSGAGNRFVTNSNWVGGSAPGPNDTAQFGNHAGATTILVNSDTITHLEFLSTRTAIHDFSYDDGTAILTLNGNFTVQAGPAVNFFLNGFSQVNLALASGEHVFDIGAATTVKIDSLLTGGGHLSKVGAGTLVLTGANTLNYDGVGSFNNGIAVDGGTLHLNGGSISQSFQDIIVGSVAGGTGVLLVSDGGDVTTKYGVAGNDTGTNATITVTGTGSTWTNSQGMAVGYLGTGFLNILAGGTVTTTGSGTDHSYLGLQSGTAGTAAVSGAGSAWHTPNDQLIIGGGGAGTLTIDSGGVVTSASADIGLSSGGIGNVLITGTNSAWSSAGNFNIGPAGTGTVTVAWGGTLAANNGAGAVALASAGGTGILNIGGSGGSSDPGGIVNALFITTGSGSGTVQFGTDSNTFSNPYYLTRDGTPGGPAVTITGATQVVNTWGFNALTGANTYTGGTRIHHGTLLVRGAGSISHAAANLMIGQNLGDNGRIHVDAGGDVTVAETRLGLIDGAAGYATVDGTGSTLSNTNYLYVGLAGFGELNITAGGAVSSPNTSIGNNLTGEGQVLVGGSGSTLTNTSALYVGSEGLGFLDITQGGLVNSATASIGHNPGGEGYVHLDVGGTFNTSGLLVIANAANGYLDVNSGSTVTAADATLGATDGIWGELYLSASGTTFATSGNLVVGAAGDGYLEAGSGADVTTGGNAVIASGATSFGDAYLFGSGSTWSVTGTLTIGGDGDGELFLSDDALLSVGGGTGTVTLGANAAGSGRLFMGFFNGEGGDAAGILDAADVTTGAGSGQVYFGSISSSRLAPLHFTRDGTSEGAAITISGSTQVWHDFGYTVLSGANSYSGGTQITGGTLVADHATALGSGDVILDGGTLSVASGITFSNNLLFSEGGGRLGGDGTFSSPLTLGNGAIISPGSSPGTLNFSSGLTLNDGGALEIELQAPTGTPGTDWDFLNITGTLDLSPLTTGNYTLFAISLMPNGNPGPVSGLTAPTSWTIATASGGILGFESTDWVIDSLQFSGGGNFTLAQSGNSLVLTFVAVPEPSTYVLFALGLGFIGLTVWRRRSRTA